MTHFVEAEPLTYISRYEGDDINNYIESLNNSINPITIASIDEAIEYSLEL